MVVETLVATFMGYLIKTFKDSKVAGKALDELSEATWNWVRPIFLKDDEPLKDLKNDPDDSVNQQMVNAMIKKHLKNNPDELAGLQALVDKINAGQTTNKTNSVTVSGDGSIVVQDVAQSNIHINALPK
jgi:hypothetical protein